MFGIKQIDSKSSTLMIFNTDRAKTLCNYKGIERSGYS